MYPKQLTIFRANQTNMPSTDVIASKLQNRPFAPVTGLDWFNNGFTEPNSFSRDLIFKTENTWRISLKKQERVIPSASIKECLDEKIAQIQESENRKVGRKEQNELKEQIIDSLLPKALTKSTITNAIYHAPSGFLMIDTANSKKAEAMIGVMRIELGGLDVELPKPNQSLIKLMNHWLLSGACDGNFELDSDCELKGAGDVAPVVKVSKQDLTAEEVVQHVQNGKFVTQLGLVWREQIAFVLTKDFTLKRIQFLDVLQEQAEQHGDDAASLAYASQEIAADSLAQMIEELVGYLGGWEE